MSTVNQSSFKGYWVEPFVAILTGKKMLQESTFEEYAQILYRHRVQGTPFPSDTMVMDEIRKSAIQEMYNEYQSLNEVPELDQRVSLLSTSFMKNIAQHGQLTLTDAQVEYVVEQGTPGALRACEATYLLGNKEIKNWLVDYRLACSIPEVIAPHTDLVEGFSKQERLELSKKRLAASGTWYPNYKKGEVSKSDLIGLVNEFSKVKLGDSKAGQNLENIHMINAFRAYKEHSKDFPENRSDLYWSAVITAINKFIKSAA